MSDSHLLPDAIQWHEGMLLAPQHFQQADQRSEGLVQYHARVVSPFHWGVRRLRFDPRSLSSGTLEVVEIEAILPDGTLVIDPPTPEERLSADLTEPAAAIEGRGTLTVHLAVPARRRPDEPVAGSLSRYRSVEGPNVVDENTGDSEAGIPRLRPRATLRVEHEPGEKYTHMPLARITVQNDTFTLSDFAPPRLHVEVAQQPGRAVAELVGRVRDQARFIADEVRATPPGSAGTDRAVELQSTVEKLSAGLPVLEAHLATGISHPFDVYLALANLAGHLAGLVPGTVPDLFRAWNQNDPVGSFAPMLDFCHRVVDSVQKSYEMVVFAFDGDAFHLKLVDALPDDGLLLGVAAAPGMDAAAVHNWIMEARIGTDDVMESLIERRIRGAERTAVEGDDAMGVVPSGGVRLFRVRSGGDFVAPGRVLRIAHPAQHQGRQRPAEILLYRSATAGA